MVGRGEYVADMGYLGWAAVWDVAAPARRDAGIRHDGDSLEIAELHITIQRLGYQTRVVNACNCIQMVEKTWPLGCWQYSSRDRRVLRRDAISATQGHNGTQSAAESISEMADVADMSEKFPRKLGCEARLHWPQTTNAPRLTVVTPITRRQIKAAYLWAGFAGLRLGDTLCNHVVRKTQRISYLNI